MNAVGQLAHSPAENSYAVVIVGAGPVGMRLLDELNDPKINSIAVVDEDLFEPYNRVALTELLAGKAKVAELMNTRSLIERDQVSVRLYRSRVVEIDREAQTVLDTQGNIYRYQKLVLATGSKPAIPGIPGINLPGVYVFRTMSDVQQLVARRARTHHTVVLGGGPLGIEAARGMQKLGTQVTLIDHNAHLMFNQLDPTSGALLAEELKRQGVNLRLAVGVRQCLGITSLEGLSLTDGSHLDCDTLVLATGIRPSTQLAVGSGIAVGRGIRVDAQMRTSDANIYAVGECCEFEGSLYGLVAPGYEQAAIAAGSLMNQEASYRGTMLATSLKVLGLPLFSMGDADPSDRSVVSYTFQTETLYRRINLRRGRVVGVIAIGDWTELALLRERLKKGQGISPWAIWRFRKTGDLWAQEQTNVHTWPAQAIVCNCNSVSKKKVCDAIDQGCGSVAELGSKTASGTTCGTCRPLLAELLGGSATPEPVRAWRSQGGLAVLAGLALAVAVFLPAASYSSSVDVIWNADRLWTISQWKQYSGYSLLTFLSLGLVLTFRKRLAAINQGSFDYWRLFHIALGVVSLGALAVHTGFRFGSNINFYLMSLFVALTALGVGLSLVIAFAHQLQPSFVRKAQKFGQWSHVMLFWPVPVLLTFHVLKTYYY